MWRAAAMIAAVLLACTSVPASAANMRVVDPFPMSAVELTGDWSEAQSRNQEVLVGLNMTRWACHFTTAANLTSCAPSDVPWHAYLKNAGGSGYTHKSGFLVHIRRSENKWCCGSNTSFVVTGLTTNPACVLRQVQCEVLSIAG